MRAPGGPPRRRGIKRDRDRVTREEVLATNAPAGSRFKGYETLLVRELVMSTELVCYRRERWLTPEHETNIAPLPAGLIGGPAGRPDVSALYLRGRQRCPLYRALRPLLCAAHRLQGPGWAAGAPAQAAMRTAEGAGATWRFRFTPMPRKTTCVPA